MEWLLGWVVAVELAFWQYVLAAGAGVILGMVVLRILVPVTLLAAFSALVRRLYIRLKRPAMV